MRKIQILALVSGLATFLLVLTVSKNVQKPVVQEIVREQIVMAAVDIIPYTEITAEMLSIREVEADAIHQSAIREMEEVVGKISKAMIFADEPILSAKIDEKESLAAGLALQVAPGKRAISIIVGIDTGVANNLRVGSWVDMLTILPSELPEDILRKYNDQAMAYSAYFELLAGNSAQANEKSEMTPFDAQTVPKVMMLLQDMKVLALDQNFISNYVAPWDMGIYTSVTLEVTPEQAMMIHLAENNQEVRLILRNQADHEILEIDGIVLRDLMKEKEEGEE